MVYAVTSLCRNLHVIWIWPSTHTYTVSCGVHTQTCFVIYTANKSSTWIIVANICIEFVHNLDPFVMQSTLQSLQKEKHNSLILSGLWCIHTQKQSVRTVGWQPRPICQLSVSEDVLRVCVSSDHDPPALNLVNAS